METLESILVGIDGSERGKKALKWAARLANREGAHLTLLAVIDPASDQLTGSDHRVLREAVENVLGEAQEFVRGDYPELAMDASYVSGDIVEALVGAAESNDMIVMGSHHGASVAERVWGAKGLRVSVSASVPTVVVPADWDPYNEAKGIVVGVVLRMRLATRLLTWVSIWRKFSKTARAYFFLGYPHLAFALC